MASTMKAAFIQEVGPWSNIQYGDLPKPTLSEHQVLVKVMQVVVNPVDTYIRSGQYRLDLPLPYIIGRDMWGIVEAVGNQVKTFKPGDQVWCNNRGIHSRQGSFAEYLAVDENLLYHLPADVLGIEVVAVCHSALTAYVGLTQKAQLKPNETIFINGGSGNVGSAIIQLAHAMHAHVITTAGTEEKMKWCKELGADRVINYKTENVEKAIQEFAPQGVDVYWDTTREPNFEKALALLAFKGRIILMAGLNARPIFPVGPFYAKNASMFGFTITNATVEEMAEGAKTINRLLKNKQIKAKVYKMMSLKDAAEAHRLQESDRDLWGKIVLQVSSP
jgi:NADPH2:quinone reductase